MHRRIVEFIGPTVERSPAEHTAVERREIEEARAPRLFVADRVTHAVSIAAKLTIRSTLAPNEVEDEEVRTTR